MGWGTGNLGGGSGGLNFRIVGGTSEPSNPRENLIWVNTDVKITSWVFSTDEPENPESGMVWILSGTSSTVEFNALKKNAITVYPSVAMQYVDGEWIFATAKTYQNGKWAEWTKYLYNKGDECTGITGGWETINGRTDGYTITGTYKNNGDSYTLTANTAKTCVTRITKSKIDFADVNTLSIVILSATGRFFNVLITTSTNTVSDQVANLRCEEASGVFQLDVSNLSGMYYVCVQRLNGDSGSNSGSVTVSQIYLE